MMHSALGVNTASLNVLSELTIAAGAVYVFFEWTIIVQ